MIQKISNTILLGVGALLLQSCGGEVTKTQAETDKPNVLFISVDDLNDWTGVSKGHPDVKTPNLERLAQRGVYFTNAHASVAVCTPSRLAVLSSLAPTTTGCYTNKSGTRNMDVWNEVNLLPVHMRENGYHTMACGKIEGHACWEIEEKFEHQKLWDERKPRAYALTEKLIKDGNRYGAPDFYPFPMGGSGTVKYNKEHGTNFPGFSLCAGPIDREYLPEGKMPDELNVEWAIEKLQKDYDKPFMLGVGFLRPHVPYTAPREYFEMYPLDEIEVPKAIEDEFADIPMYGKAMAEGITEPGAEHIVRTLGEDYRKQLVQGYLASITFMDAQLGKLLDALDKSKYGKNTIIVLWSDHGQCFGEKMNWRKNNIWNEATVAPMLWIVPGVTDGGQVNKNAVSLLDIYPTLTGLCDVNKSKQQDGEDILPLLQDMNVKRKKPVVSTWTYGSHSIRRDNWRYIRYNDGSEELYDEVKDFGEHINLANDPKYKAVVKELKQYLPKDIYQPTDKNKEYHMINNRVERWTKNPKSMPDYFN